MQKSVVFTPTNWLIGKGSIILTGSLFQIKLIGIMTGHCRLKRHLKLMRIEEDTIYPTQDERMAYKKAQSESNSMGREVNGEVQHRTDPESRSVNWTGRAFLGEVKYKLVSRLRPPLSYYFYYLLTIICFFLNF